VAQKAGLWGQEERTAGGRPDDAHARGAGEACREGPREPDCDVRALRAEARPRSLLAGACDYLLGHWEPLTAHLSHGQTRLDNNLIENAIRPSAIGKKNWLFIGHPDAGQRSAIIYSVVVSCQRHGHDPLAYLRDVLTRLPTLTNRFDLDTLTPVNWKPA